MRVSLPQLKVENLISKCKEIVQSDHTTIHKIASLIGSLNATAEAVVPAALYVRELQMHKTKCLVKTPTYKAEVTLQDHCKEEIHWWIQSLSQWNGKHIISQEPDIVLETDASLEGWGVPLSSTERKIRGSMERPREKGTHKCPGNDGSRHRSEVGNKRPTQNTRTCENGQCNYSQICEQNGGYQIPETDPYCKTNMAVLPHERDHDYCRTPAWNSQQNSGLGKQARVQRQHEQLETESRYFETNRSPSRAPRIGSVCGKNERPNRQIFQLETRPPGCGVGRIHQNLDRGKSVRTPPPILPHSKSISKNTKGKSTNCADSTSLAHTSILPNASRNYCQQSNSITTSEGPPSVARGTMPSTSSKQHVKTSGMADLRQTRQMQGLSADTAELWVSAWRSGTQSAYDSCWRKWASWCRERQINPFQASVENVINFLSHLYTEGYEYSTINNYRSAISAIHPEIDGEKVGQKHTVKQVMAGIFNKRPPLPRYTNTWDVDVVLNHIQNMPSNKDLCLKNLSIKTATLIALTSAARASEICALDTKFMQITDSEISFTVTDLTKTRKVKDTCGKVTFPSFEDSQLDVRSCIIDYLKATEPIRTVSKLLISYVKPHNAIKPCSMARWLKTKLGTAGIDTNVFKAQLVVHVHQRQISLAYLWTK